jgi:IS30 family transposase
MYLRRDSLAGIRFLAAVRDGSGLKPSARAAGVGKETGYRWLRESFTELGQQGLSVTAPQLGLGFHSPLVLE